MGMQLTVRGIKRVRIVLRVLTQAFSLLLPLVLSGVPAAAYTNLGESCPAKFRIVDLGVWAEDGLSPTPHRFGGVLIDVGMQDKSETYLYNSRIDCAILPNDDAPIPFRNGLPIALATSVNLRTLKLKYLGVASIGNRGSAKNAYDTLERRNAEAFRTWEASAKSGESGRSIEKGVRHTCLYDPSNPTLSGEGNYTCLLVIDGMPNPNTLVGCNAWGGCTAEFSFLNGLSFRISVPRPKDMQTADVPMNIGHAVIFWNKYILSFRSAFENAIIERDDQIIWKEN